MFRLQAIPVLFMALCVFSWDAAGAGEGAPVASAAPSEAKPDVSFSAKPTAAKDGDRVKFSFAVSAQTDVEVAVLAADGKIVRHLAAGVLGAKNPPPEPLKPGLAQTIEWDLRDDAGKPAAGGPFKARVRLGLKPAFDGFLLHNPHATGGATSVAVGPGGQVYMAHPHITANPNMGYISVKVYDRNGRYLRTLMPYPADIAPERVKAMGAFTDQEKRIVPRVHNWEQLNLYPNPIGSRGRSFWGFNAAVDSKGRMYWVELGPVLMALDADGGAPFETFVGPRLLPDVGRLRMSNRYLVRDDNPCLALSGDEKHIYLSGLWVGDYDKHKEPGNHKPLPCVFRVDAAKRGPGEVFLGKRDQSGKEGDLLVQPRGMAVANGLVYVADIGANRVAVFSEKDRSPVGQISVKAPDTIGVDPASGAVYVCSMTDNRKGDWHQPDLVKFDGYQNGKELYRITLPRAYGGHRIAVDASAKPVRIWMPAASYGFEFLCIEDTGAKFEFRGDPRPKAAWAPGPRDLTVDRRRGELYVKVNGEQWHRIDEKTGKVTATIGPLDGLQMNDKATQLVACEDGNLVTLSWEQGLRRWTREGKPLAWQGKGDNKGNWGGIMTFTQNYLAIRGDEMFAIPPGGARTCLNVYGMDLKPKRTAVWGVTPGTIPRVDSKGNIFLATMLRPPGKLWPEFFDGKLDPAKARAFSSEYWYCYMYGSIVKFPPSGGSIWWGDDKPSGSAVSKPPAELLAKPKTEFGYTFETSPGNKGKLQGAEWQRLGFAPYSETYPSGTSYCMCEGAGFDVDDYGRVFYPNLGQFRVEMVDNSNNFIGTFGHYGNEDSGGPDAKVKTPEIPLAWPTYVAVSDTHAYVNDTLSNRVVRVKLGAAAEETVDAR